MVWILRTRVLKTALAVTLPNESLGNRAKVRTQSLWWKWGVVFIGGLEWLLRNQEFWLRGGSPSSQVLQQKLGSFHRFQVAPNGRFRLKLVFFAFVHALYQLSPLGLSQSKGEQPKEAKIILPKSDISSSGILEEFQEIRRSFASCQLRMLSRGRALLGNCINALGDL